MKIFDSKLFIVINRLYIKYYKMHTELYVTEMYLLYRHVYSILLLFSCCSTPWISEYSHQDLKQPSSNGEFVSDENHG